MSEGPYRVVVTGGRAVMELSGEVGIEQAGALRTAGEAALADGADDLVLDMAAVSFVDSAGIGAIVHLNNVAGARGKTLRLTQVSRSVRRPFQLSGLTGLVGAEQGPAAAPPDA